MNEYDEEKFYCKSKHYLIHFLIGNKGYYRVHHFQKACSFTCK